MHLEKLDLQWCGSLTGLFRLSHDDFDFNSSFAAVPNIGELKNLETLNLASTGITGTADFKHHPVMAAEFWCITEVPSSISELKKLDSLDLSCTGITGTVDFDHHPMMISDCCCAFQTSME